MWHGQKIKKKKKKDQNPTLHHPQKPSEVPHHQSELFSAPKLSHLIWQVQVYLHEKQTGFCPGRYGHWSPLLRNSTKWIRFAFKALQHLFILPATSQACQHSSLVKLEQASHSWPNPVMFSLAPEVLMQTSPCLQGLSSCFLMGFVPMTCSSLEFSSTVSAFEASSSTSHLSLSCGIWKIKAWVL